MYEFQYQSSCLAWNGERVQRTSKGYFSSRDVLNSHLNHWSGQPAPGGGTYQYWESDADKAANNAAKNLDDQNAQNFRLFEVLRYGVQSRSNLFVNFNTDRFERELVGCYR
jgi:hypothetical protein